MTEFETKEVWADSGICFGDGKVFVNGNQRKIVTPGRSDFHYEVETGLMEPINKEQLEEFLKKEGN